MLRRFSLLVLMASAAASAPPARAEMIPGPRPLSGAIALGTNGAGTVAVAYESRRGLMVAVSPRGGRFRRAVRVAPLARGARYDDQLAVTVGMSGDVLVVWDRFDATEPPEDDSRDEGCCMRVHAARLTPAGRRRPLQVLTPAGSGAWHADAAVSRSGRAAVTWIHDRLGNPWRVRVAARGGRFGPQRTLKPTYEGGDQIAAFVGPVLRALFIRGRSLFERRGRDRFRRIARRIQEDGEGFTARDAAGRLLIARQDQLIAVPSRGRARVRFVPRRRKRDLRVFSSAAGRTALVFLPAFFRGASRRAEMRLGTIAGDLGRGRRLTVGRAGATWNLSRTAVSHTGDAALFVLGKSKGKRRRGLYLARVSRWGSGPVQAQRVAWVSWTGELAGAAYDAGGRPLAVVRDRGRNRVIRP